MQVTKFYPKKSTDNGGLKFYFDHGDAHYTIRFAGNPILILEAMFIKLGGDKELFMKAYHKELDMKEYEGQYNILKLAVKKAGDIQEFFSEVYDIVGRSPFVVYANTKSSFK